MAENRTANTVNGIIKIFISGSMEVLEITLRAKVPFLSWPIITWITDYVLRELEEFLYEEFATFATFTIIDSQTNAQVSAYEKAKLTLLSALKGGDQDEIKRAREVFSKTGALLIRWNGHARI